MRYPNSTDDSVESLLLPSSLSFSVGDFGQFPIPETMRVSGFPEGVKTRDL